jgi:hypothetical protein
MVGDASDEKPSATSNLEVEVRMLRELLAREQDTVSDLRARLDSEAEERRRLTALLTHQPDKAASVPEPAPVAAPQPSIQLRKLSWWQRLTTGAGA